MPEEDIREVASIALDQDWTPPSSFPEHYRDANVISIDLETRDPNLMTLGPGWARNDGYIIGYAVALTISVATTPYGMRWVATCQRKQ